MRPGRPGISFEQVAAVANGLVAAGKEPSWRTVRATTGHGAPGTIQQHLRRWHEERESSPTAVPELSPALLRTLTAEISALVMAGVAAEQERRRQADEAAADIAQENERLENELEATHARVAELETALASAQGANDELRQDAARARLEAAEARREAQEARDALSRATAKLEALSRMEADWAETRRELALATREVAQWQAQDQVQGQRLADAQAALDKAEAEAAGLSTRLEREHEARQLAERHAAVAVAQLEMMRDERDRLEARLKSPELP